MAYLALYRAFRPTTLNDVVRQEHIVTVLKNQLATGRIGHAYLFCGPRGTGKTSIAKIFAAAMNCQSPKDGSPCGACAACRALLDPSNLDISEIDAASNNGVDEMRDLREKVQYPPVAGKYKVYIIDEVHMLSTGAFNALLKTLEEPPAHAVFILATTEATKIPATILSRCMRFDFKLIPQADLETRLEYVLNKIGKTYEKEAVAAIARAGAGSVRDMLSIADTCVSYTEGKLTYADVTSVLGSADFNGVLQLCEALLKGDSGAAFSKAEEFLAAGKAVGTLVKDLLTFFNSCAIAKLCRDGKTILALPSDSYAKVEKIARETDGHRLLRATEIFAETEQSLKYSTSPRVLFETAVLKASMPQTDYHLESLLARLSALETKLEQGDFIIKNGGRDKAKEKLSNQEKKLKLDVPPSQTREAQPNGEEDVPPAPDAPPDETQTGGYAYFDVENSPRTQEGSEDNRQTTNTPATQRVTGFEAVTPPLERAATVKPAVKGDAKTTFGAFLRSLRKTGKNGVLFTICMDLDSVYEGDTFVLYTESETIYRSLTKPEHASLIQTAFEAIGILKDAFEVRLKGKQTDALQKDIEQIKKTFDGIKIDVK